MNYELFMAEAIAEARRGGEEGEVPVGAVAVLDDAMIARDHDRILLQRDPTAHAVLLTLQATARKLESRRLTEVTIFTTHEPCAMCVGALVETEVFALVYAVPDEERERPAAPSSWPAARPCRTSCPWSPACARRRLGGWQPRRRPTPERPAGGRGSVHPLLDSAAERCPSGLRCRSRKAVCDEHRGFESHPLRHSHHPPPPHRRVRGEVA